MKNKIFCQELPDEIVDDALREIVEKECLLVK